MTRLMTHGLLLPLSCERLVSVRDMHLPIYPGRDLQQILHTFQVSHDNVRHPESAAIPLATSASSVA
jgi:hypothetical protein